MAETDGALDYPWLVTMDEMLMLCIGHCELARHADSNLVLGVQLKMASMALRCALEIYGSGREKVPEKEVK